MVLQYKLKKEKRWKDYNGKNKLELSTNRYDFRLLSSKRKKLLVDKRSYEKIQANRIL